MDFEYTPEQEAFRAEVRAWLAENLPPDLCIDDPMDERIAPNREVFEKRRAWQNKLAEAGWVGLSWPREYGGRARQPDGANHLRRGILQGAGADSAGLFRRRPARTHADAMGYGGAEEKVSSADPARRRYLVPGLLGARRRLRSRRPADARRAQGRLLRRQRAEGLDLRRAVSRTRCSCSRAPIPTRPSTRASAT